MPTAMGNLCVILILHAMMPILTISTSIGRTCSESVGNMIFAHEPCNLTISEFESVIFNCSLVHRSSQDQATWIIRGLQYYFHDFQYTPEYSYNPLSGSLTIHNASRSQDGSTFQCIINRKSSRVGYLTVEYQSETVTPDLVLTHLSTTDYEGNFTSYHESFDFAATTTSIEENGGSMMNTEWKVLGPVLMIVIIMLITSIIATLAFIGYCHIRYRAKLSSLDDDRAIPHESIPMETNVVYGVNTNISTKRNISYEYTGKISSPDHHKCRS